MSFALAANAIAPGPVVRTTASVAKRSTARGPAPCRASDDVRTRASDSCHRLPRPDRVSV